MQMYVLQHRAADMLCDGWKWKAGGFCKRPPKNPLYRRSVYYFHS